MPIRDTTQEAAGNLLICIKTEPHILTLEIIMMVEYHIKKTLTLLVLCIFYFVNLSYSAHKNSNFSGAVNPVIYTSDLFHPHADPDDHWDLVTVYALASKGMIELQGICLNWPCERVFKQYFNTPIGDPAVISIAQMNYITGKTIPCCVGSDKEMKSLYDTQSDYHINGVNMIINTLRLADHKVMIHIVGSARDVAIAGNREPDLFAQKCAAIYLVAGRSDGDPNSYNVTLDCQAFARIFQLPCPVYWVPCLKAIKDNKVVLGEYDCWYTFKQREILPDLSNNMQNFFIFAFKPGWQPNPKSEAEKSFSYASLQWLRAVTGEPDNQAVTKYGSFERNMWSTPAFLHCAGKTVTCEGEIIDREKLEKDNAVFAFKPVKIKIKDDKVIKWSLTEESTNRYIFQKNIKYYDFAMTKALRELLISLP